VVVGVLLPEQVVVAVGAEVTGSNQGHAIGLVAEFAGLVARRVTREARDVAVAVLVLGQPAGRVVAGIAGRDQGHAVRLVKLDADGVAGGVIAVAGGVVVGVAGLGQPVGLVPGPGVAAELAQVALAVVLQDRLAGLAVGSVVAVLHHS